METKININTGVIYPITNTINNKKYIGQVHSYYINGLKYGYTKRWNKHISSSKQKDWNKKCRALYAAFRLHGIENFKCNLVDVIVLNDLDGKEKEYIKIHNTLAPNGYNLTEGGKNGRRSQETREKLSKSLIGHKLSDETKNKISESLSGEKHPNWGKKHSEKTLKKCQ